ncbi:TonB-dependent receptor [Pelagicoccus sp. SDUM812002]|uniref:TonB-dependent receptor domain-containing protein n=1 Tax=Pelagicoccus sp. SDUM812002 TaxID=3041266 RepID=UPI00280C4E65|nr:TonB-dependent receptor [Pelagicoccus sp. SDUM812002]MDQ8184559.1 TonB-dependent receptor [Pelagicoccus sp. SDUM812002]
MKQLATLQRRTLRAKVTVLFIASGLLATNAAAQEETEEPFELEPFKVVGSHLSVTEMADRSNITPVSVVMAADFDARGFSTTSEALQSLSVNNGGSVPISNNATGFTPSASSVSLRGLGPEATLVLINGRRVAPFPVGTDGTTAFVDLNSFPLAAIDRIEVLKDGASALYGADAVAGVVNIVTKRDFRGTELTVKYGNTTSADAGDLTVNLVSGMSDEDGSVTVGANYYKRNAIFNRDREYSEVPPFLSSNASPLNFQITREAALQALGLGPGDAIPGLDDGVAVEDREDLFFTSTFDNRDSNDGTLPATDYQYSDGRSSSYNFNETAGSYPEYERKGGFLSWDKKMRGTESLFLYGDLFYQNTYSVNELAPSATGNFGNPGGISLVIPASTDAPILTPDEVAAGSRSAAVGAFNPFNPFNQDFSGGTRARLAEFGNRIYRDTNDALNATLGLRTDSFLGGWNLDASLSYSSIKNTTRNTLVSISRFNRLSNAADPIFDETSDEYIGTTIPYNPFGYYQNEIENNALIAPYAKVDLKDTNESSLYGTQVVISKNDLFRINDNPVGFALGYEYRWETLSQSPDAAASTGDVIGSSTSNITDAEREIGSLYFEMNMPIVLPENDASWAYSFTANLAGRYEDFVTQEDSIFVPKASLRYLPFDDSFAIRASWGEGYRQPSMYELYAQGLTYTLTPVTNPLTSVNEPEQDASIASNPTLKAEESTNQSLGLIWTPSFLATDNSAASFNLDYWSIERNGNVTVDHQDVVNRFFANETLLAGEGVQLDASDQIVLVDGIFRNLGNEDATGFDIGASYFVDTDFGRWDFSVNASYLDSYEIQQFPSAPFFEYVGWTEDVLFDNTTGDPSPGAGDDAFLQWKGVFAATWSKAGTSVNLVGNYTDGYRDFSFDWDPGNPNDPAGFNQVEATILWDITASHNFWEGQETWLGDTKITVGIRNLLDEAPPYVSSWGNNSTGYSGFLYSSEGRFAFISINKKI